MSQGGTLPEIGAVTEGHKCYFTSAKGVRTQINCAKAERSAALYAARTALPEIGGMTAEEKEAIAVEIFNAKESQQELRDLNRAMNECFAISRGQAGPAASFWRWCCGMP